MAISNFCKSASTNQLLCCRFPHMVLLCFCHASWPIRRVVLTLLLLLPCRLRQLRAAAADPELAHVHGAAGSHSELRGVVFQGAPAECRKASQRRECSSQIRVCVVVRGCLLFFYTHTPLYSLLIINIPYFVLQAVLCFGISSDKMVVRSTADTVQACAPTLTQVTLIYQWYHLWIIKSLLKLETSSTLKSLYFLKTPNFSSAFTDFYLVHMWWIECMVQRCLRVPDFWLVKQIAHV